MPSRRSTRSSDGRSQKRPSPEQKGGTGRTRGRRRRARSKKSDAQNGVVDTSDDGARDLIDIIDSNEASQASTQQDFHAEVAHRAACDSDDDRLSDSSLSSGPSVPLYTTNKNPKSSSTLCSVCHKLHRKAKRTKKPIKDKLLDNGEFTGFVI